MAAPGDTQLHELEERMARSDPRFARGLGEGRPRRPREYRHGPAWALLAVSLAMQVVGMLLPQGLLLAAGLVVAGIAAHLFVSPPGLRRSGEPWWRLPHSRHGTGGPRPRHG
ncbi:hypothetical protein VT50_0201005 [Streptomyces antioxidans]|uniref:DUF3040 domain-containing protein n=1 Tax=Streptomyces antioxidans TaxID=1507734 RepID=A0A1V4DD63_9ACTN|nr:DUF3040 domain-containing protein [Streptomyces antioxidans]OPF84644.1 hypothetical protein VT50_0201005 [Streptomyces antioxidans]